MPQAADLVLQNAAAANKTFTLLNPAAGMNSLCNWALKEGTISSVFPKISLLAKTTGNQSQQTQTKLRIPSSYTDTVTGLTKVGSAFEVNMTVSVPNDFPEALKADAAAFTQNLMANAIIKACYKDGLPAT